MWVFYKEKSHLSEAGHAMNGWSDIAISLYPLPRKEEKAKVPHHQIAVAVNVHLFIMYSDITVWVCRKTQKKQQFSFHKKNPEIAWLDKTMKVRWNTE